MEKFDASDPAERAADPFRKQVAELLLSMRQNSDFRALSISEQAFSFTVGTSTAMVGACLCCFDQGSHDQVMDVIRSYLPTARLQAEAIIATFKTEGTA
ncbi:MAG: hypothetical protein WA418_30335 [Bradyrhizobium sp.]